MDKFVPYKKLSKKKKRQLDVEKRGSWYGFNPITRKPKNPKAYNRMKARCWQKHSSNVLSSSFIPAEKGKAVQGQIHFQKICVISRENQLLVISEHFLN